MSTSDFLLGLALIVALAVGSQVVARQFGIPALVILLPVGFAAGAFTNVVDPTELLGPAFQPLVDLAVALILYDAGLRLDLRRLTGHTRRVVLRLILVGVPLTALVAAWGASVLLHMSAGAALMLGVIVVVSGPTVVGPLLATIRPSERVQRVLMWEGSLIDPIGGVLGAVTFAGVAARVKVGTGHQFIEFLLSVGVGLLGAAAGLGLLWLLLHVLDLMERDYALGTSAQLATVVLMAAVCDAIRSDAGLVAAVLLGLAVANLPGFHIPERKLVSDVLGQLIIGLLFISISATVTPSSVARVIGPTLALIAVLVVIVRPLAAALSTWHTDLSRGERGLIGWMAPRGIVAAATASTFGAQLAAKQIPGATKILPVTFVIVVGTVTLYGLTAGPAARKLGVVRPARTRPLLIGGDPWVVDLAQALRQAGLDVLVWATDPSERNRLSAAGLRVAPSDMVPSAVARGKQMEGVTAVLLLTAHDDFNAAAASQLGDTVDGDVYLVAPPSKAHGVMAPDTTSGTLFAEGLTGAAIRERQDAGAHVVVARSIDDDIPPGHDLLFLVNPEGRLVPATAVDPPTPTPADTVVLLAG